MQGQATQDQPRLGRGFAAPVHDAQAAFRLALAALSGPGTVLDVPPLVAAPDGLHPATAALLLALADFETPFWLPEGLAEAGAWLRFHCGSALVTEPSAALFAVVDGSRAAPPLAAFGVGTDQFPDRSTTVLVQCGALDGGEAVALAGPGIETVRMLAPSGLPAGFWDGVMANAQLYPVGIDMILVCGSRIVGLPRTTQVRRVG